MGGRRAGGSPAALRHRRLTAALAVAGGLRPGPAMLDPGAGLISRDDCTGSGRLLVNQSHSGGARPLTEGLLASAENHREDHKGEAIEQALGEQSGVERAAALDEQVGPITFLQL